MGEDLQSKIEEISFSEKKISHGLSELGFIDIILVGLHKYENQ